MLYRELVLCREACALSIGCCASSLALCFDWLIRLYRLTSAAATACGLMAFASVSMAMSMSMSVALALALSALLLFVVCGCS